jgi:fatty acid desaturase
LLWAAAMPVVAFAQYARPALSPYLAPLGCYLALSAGVMAHNHNHSPTFKNKRLNGLWAAWLSVFYGYPTFAWIPTHNLNHHKFVNRAGDATITWRHTKSHNIFVAFTYFFVSSYWQSDPIKAFIRKARAGNPALFRTIVTQYAVWAGFHLTMLAAAIGLSAHRAGALDAVSVLAGLKLFGLAFALPAFFALWTIMWFNYAQHIHADPWSEHNHSRSFTGKLLNFLLFNNGYHAAHHEFPGAHWSKLAEHHEQIAPHIDERLVHTSLWPWVIKTYFLAPFIPSLGTQQVGRPAYDDPKIEQEGLVSADVDAAEAGENAPMVRT